MIYLEVGRVACPRRKVAKFGEFAPPLGTEFGELSTPQI